MTSQAIDADSLHAAGSAPPIYDDVCVRDDRWRVEVGYDNSGDEAFPSNRKLMLSAMEEDEQMKNAKSTPERRQIERDEDYLGLTDPKP